MLYNDDILGFLGLGLGFFVLLPSIFGILFLMLCLGVLNTVFLGVGALFGLSGSGAFALVGALVGFLHAMGRGGGYIIFPLFAAVSFNLLYQFGILAIVPALLLYCVSNALVRA